MPELVLFKRRWHAASDALPALMILLCLFHVLWFIPYATGSYTVESTGVRYECPQGIQLRVANYSLFALFAAAAINEALITVFGLRGGPFQTRKRRLVPYLLYVELALWVLLLGFTIYATVLVYGDEIAQGCWSNNPCQFNDRVQLPLGCTDKKGDRITQLSDSCQRVYNNGRYFLGACWTNWLAFGLNWAVGFESYISRASAECVADPECRGNITSFLNVTGGGGDVQSRFHEALTELLNQAL